MNSQSSSVLRYRLTACRTTRHGWGDPIHYIQNFDPVAITNITAKFDEFTRTKQEYHEARHKYEQDIYSLLDKMHNAPQAVARSLAWCRVIGAFAQAGSNAYQGNPQAKAAAIKEEINFDPTVANQAVLTAKLLEANMSAESDMLKARAQLLMDQPFFGALALRLKLVQDDETRDVTDGVRLVYNSKFIGKLDTTTRKGLIAHEVMHCVFNHMTRRQERDPKMWNIATDYAINNHLIESGRPTRRVVWLIKSMQT